MEKTDRPAAAAAELASSFGFEAVAPAVKAGRVRQVFDSVAGRYDLMNDLMSFGVHRLWKEAVLDWLAPRPGIHLLDLAGGTGDVAERVLRRVGGDGRAVLADINAAMLGQGRDRALGRGWFDRLAFVCADAMALPFEAGRFDAVTMAFGIRNVTHVDRALAEGFRVLRPGGRFMCLEFSKVVLPVLDRVYDTYSFQVLPALGRIVAGDAASYRYLAESIRRFPDQPTFADLMRDAGFEQVRWRNLSGGIAAIHSGWRL
ncbi:MAG: bifunctional demethylmenaquinone methyltransferase/2-methoxy-6-polyprenyl-1,4-benzoquinol methylase UbiE [Geminicoccaceae bacterium]|jgi:demethylmenaquinone methyltransferase/2-methoxy-6-polyprenyl-1,4-benzoquinol methylase|nr:bifunctional demethylmenaquinone methyltransferase/2-methoxy-6-polyprenyl-1,4-benzoquinol methylase UbiE [Geminicoccaceae bacterium]HRY24455.1 bifunctional demethylmenaquinone methyltransferase/2-methoxy-6-polyprenyl-1,4-benzoquinol methylase UbiE [Geminicoccaceae bacterium]